MKKLHYDRELGMGAAADTKLKGRGSLKMFGISKKLLMMYNSYKSKTGAQKQMLYHILPNKGAACCGQLWVRHMICDQTCDGLYHFAFFIYSPIFTKFGIKFSPV